MRALRTAPCQRGPFRSRQSPSTQRKPSRALERAACSNSRTLAIIAMTVATVGNGRVKWSVYFMPTAHAISHTPARNRTIQAILRSRAATRMPLLAALVLARKYARRTFKLLRTSPASFANDASISFTGRGHRAVRIRVGLKELRLRATR
jgi:hypothetical protein